LLSRVGSILLAILLLGAAAGFAPAQACGSVGHSAEVIASVHARAAIVTVAVATAADQHRDGSAEHPCNGHGCCQLGAICSIACANAALVLDAVTPFVAGRLLAADVPLSFQLAGIAVDPELDPPRSITLT
jgi:hypothetical protein